MSKYEISVGERFGRGTVLRYVGQDAKNGSRWELRCDCGNAYETIASSLVKEACKSCGCITADRLKSMKGKFYEQIPGSYWSSLLTSAKARNIFVEITIEDMWDQFVKQEGKCALSGRELSFAKGKVKGTASLDRIDSKQGYEINNIQWLHKDVNQSKWDFEESNFIKICHDVTLYTPPATLSQFKPKILVTGCAGYIGNVLVRKLLDKGYRVIGIDNIYKGQADALIGIVNHTDFEFVYGDICNKELISELVKGVDGIVNLAAIVGFPACKKNPILATAVNEAGAIYLAKKKPPKVPMVQASTGSVYGKIVDICTESSYTNPQSLYGITKLNAEDGILESENTLVYRFATCFGVSPCMRVNLLINDLMYQAITNKCFAVFQADFRRTFIHINDFCDSLIFGLENIDNMDYNIYNVGSSEMNWSKRQIAEYIKYKTGSTVFYEDFAEDSDQRDYEVDYSKIENEGFKCKVSMEEGIEELIKATPLLQINHQYN